MPDTSTLKTSDALAETPERVVEARPIVSIVIVCHNQARYLAEAIQSAIGQTFAAADILVVDDGSTDATREVAQSFPVRYVHQRNRGLAAARNTGIRETAGLYVLFLDADDRLTPDAVEAGLDCFRERPDAGFVFGGFRYFHDDGSPAPIAPARRVADDHYRHLLQGNVIGMHGAVLYSRAALLAAGGFDESLPACEDYDLYLRIARHWRIAQHEQVVAEYRRHETNMSRDHAFMLNSALAVLQLEGERLRGDRRHREALRSGRRAWRHYYGERLFQQYKRQPSARGLLRVLRYYPGGVVRRAIEAVAKRMARLVPVSRQFGLERGQPIDRHYIESFLGQNAGAVRGCVLEIGGDTYSRRFGSGRIVRQEVLHVAPGYPGATIVADLTSAPHIPDEMFDCILLTQTLHYIFDLCGAVSTLERILKPGGALLLTVPGISQRCRDQADKDGDCWRFTESSVRKLLTAHFHPARVAVRSFGNVRSASAFLYGRAAHELSSRALDYHDPDYPVTVAASVIK